MTVTYRRSGPEDLPRLRSFWRQHWGDELVVAHGMIYLPEQLCGFIAVDGEEWIGLVTYNFLAEACEIVSLDSLRPNHGIGTRLIEMVSEEAKRAQCRRLFLITTNDNLEALGFYQKRGFQLAAVHPGAINEARKVKPVIPLIGLHGIPLRDEIELEMTLA